MEQQSKKRTTKQATKKTLNFKELNILYYLFRNSYVSKRQGAYASDIRDALNQEQREILLSQGVSPDEIKDYIQPREIYKLLTKLVSKEYIDYGAKLHKSNPHFITPKGIRAYCSYMEGLEEDYVEFSNAVNEYKAGWGDKMDNIIQNLFSNEEK